MTKDRDEDCAGGPGEKSCEPECGPNVASPEICERVKDEPVDWDWQVEIENDES